jgi:RHS repeat-associated protein
MEYADNGNITKKSDFGNYNYSADPNNAVSIVDATAPIMHVANTHAHYLFGNKAGKLSSVGRWTTERGNTFIYYGYDKQRVISEDHFRIENGFVIRKYIDKYYEEEWVYTESYDWELLRWEWKPPDIVPIFDTPIVVNDSTLILHGYEFKGYWEGNTHVPDIYNTPGYIKVGRFFIPFPIPEEVERYVVMPYKNGLQYIRKLHYIYGENEKLVGIYVFKENMNQPISDTMYYIHQDRLGSYETITNDEGIVLERLAYDEWGNRVRWDDWTQKEGFDFGDQAHIFRRGFTQHEHLGSFGIINMNGRIFDPNTATFFSPDPFVQDPASTQAFNRYSYCLNNPLAYTDPTGELWWLIPIAIGAYIGGSMANGTYNLLKWDYSSGKTWGYMIGGAVTGALTAGVGSAIAASGIPFANTLAIMGGSLTNSLGTHIYTGGQTDISMSLGFGSFNFSTGKLSTFSTKNSWLENLGYGLGTLANVSDILTFADKFMGVEDKIAAKANAIADKYEAQGHTQDNLNSNSVGKNLNGTSYMGKNNPYMIVGDEMVDYFGRVSGWGYKEYAAYLHDIDYINLGIPNGASSLFNSMSTFTADVNLMARQMFLSLKHFDIGGMLFGVGMSGIVGYKTVGIPMYGIRIMPR